MVKRRKKQLKKVRAAKKKAGTVKRLKLKGRAARPAAKKVKVAQEYQVVYSVKLTPKGKLAGGKDPKRVPGQFNIYDSVPGMKKYSAIWQFNYVIVPRDYVANTLRSERDCLRSGYPIKKSTVFEN